MTDLTEEQKKAVAHSKGAACVIAGAGTGKTTALAERIVFLVEKRHIAPKRIIATTFTRKATAELYERTFNRLRERAQQLRISTIDALIWDLAREAMHEGLMPTVQLIGEANQRALLFNCAWEVIGKKQPLGKSVWADRADKAGLVELLEKAIRAEIASEQDKQPIHELIRQRLSALNYRLSFELYFQAPTLHDLEQTAERYFERLRELSATDYELLSRDLLRCLKQGKIFVRQFASQMSTILVDEFQDTSRIRGCLRFCVNGWGVDHG